MKMRINHNIAALNTHRQLTGNTGAASKSLEKLSSGLRINRAGDDAAGLAISEKMRGQIRGLEMASKNAQDGISLIQTAEGALNEVHSILQRMRELAVQSSNGTTTDDDRKALQDEINQLVDEIDRIGNTTQFNTMNLLDGSQGKSVDFSATASTSKIVDVRAIASMNNETYKLTVDNVSGSAAVLNKTGTGNSIAQGEVTYDTTSTVAKVGETYTISWDDGNDQSAATVTLKDSTGKDIATLTNVDLTNSGAPGVIALDFGSGKYKFNLDTSNIGTNAGSVTFRTEMEADYTITNGGGATVETLTDQLSTNGQVDVGGFRLTVDKSLAADTTGSNLVVSGNDVEFQIGANEGQTTKLAINDMRADALGVDDLKVDSQSDAQSAITTIDKAIKLVSEERAKFGAIQNRLEHTINNLGTSAENLTAAESRIRDVDMAKEMMEFTKNNILTQAAQAMLAQANQQPQGVLQLLR
jgi:flagellin